MEALNQLKLQIKHSQPPEVADIKQHVTVFLEQIIGPSGRRKRLGQLEKCQAGSAVKRLLIAIEQRLKKKPEINLYKTHVYCLAYLKYLCTGQGSQESKFEYLERQCGLMHCYEHCLKYEDVIREGCNILTEINNKKGRKRKTITTGQVLPTYDSSADSPQTVKIVTTIGMAFLRVHWSSIQESEENEDACRRFLSLVKEMELWTVHINFQEPCTLLMLLMDCTRSLLKKRPHLMSKWFIELCTKTLDQFTNIDEMCDFGKEVCSLFLSRTEDMFFSKTNMVEHPKENIVIKFLELAGYCTVNFGAASLKQCGDLISLFRRLASKSFPEVNLSFGPLFLKHLVITLLIKDLEFFRIYGGPNLSQTLSNSEVSNALEAHLKEWTEFNNKKDFQEVHLFFHSRLSSFILSNETIDDALEDNTLKLQNILYVFDRFIDDFSSDREYERTHKHIEVAAKMGVAYYIFLLARKQDMKRREEVLMKLKKKKSCKLEVLNYLIQNLEEVFKALNGNARMNEAIESSKLCCMIQWERILSFCEMLTSTEHWVYDGFSAYTIVGLVEKAYDDGFPVVFRV